MNDDPNTVAKSLSEVPIPVSEATSAAPDRGEPPLRPEDLPGRDLSGWDLTTFGGLLPEHLAGTKLTGAKLPANIAKFEALGQVKEISAEARKIFIGLLAACIYSWLVIGTTTDVALILNTASSPLPIINTPIPIANFYVVGAALLAAVYCYLHFYLQRLWRTLASLPAVFPDGIALDEKTDPWLLTNLVRSEFAALRVNAPPLASLENVLTIILAWWLVPATLLALWTRYLPAHYWLGTTWLVLLIGLTTLFGRHTFCLAKAILNGEAVLVAEPKSHGGGGGLGRALYELRRLRPDKVTIWLTLILTMCSLSAFRDDPRGAYTWVARGLNAIGIRTYADLREVEVAQKPEGWDGKDWSKVKPVDLRGRNLAFADASGALLANADLRGANLESADLPGAQLQGANLSGANLRYALFASAWLDAADLRLAQLQDAEFYMAKLQRAVFYLAQLQGAGFRFAHLEGANLTRAQLQAADLREARLQGANLGGAEFQGADLRSAQLQGANLRQAQLQGADLRGAQLQGADLREAALWRTLINGAGWDLADLRGITVQPMLKAEIAHVIARVGTVIPDRSWRRSFAEWMTWHLRDDDRPSVPQYPAVWRFQPEIMFERSPATDRWGQSRWASERAYDADLASFLDVLACTRDVPEGQTRGVARRALANPDRLFAQRLAASLIGLNCLPAVALPDDLRIALRQLVARTDAAAGVPEASPPDPVE